VSLSHVKRGDQVFVFSRSRYSVAEYRLVVSAGPKYITTGEGYAARRFHRDSGWLRIDVGSAEIRAFVSEEACAAELEHEALAERFRKLAHEGYGFKDKYTAEQLRSVLAILRPQE